MSLGVVCYIVHYYQKLLLATSLRRISEVCVASLMNRQSTQTLGGSFCRSCDIHTRVISSLVVLLSSTQGRYYIFEAIN